eukprot:s2549_g2.t1
MANLDEVNNDNEIRRVRRINQGDNNDGEDIVARALNGYPLNGQVIDPNVEHGDSHEDMRAESTGTRRMRYRDSSQDEVSKPDEGAEVHYGHMDPDAYERMVAYSRANQLRLNRAAETLRNRHDAAAAEGNWEEAANYLRALREVEVLMDIT